MKIKILILIIILLSFRTVFACSGSDVNLRFAQFRTDMAYGHCRAVVNRGDSNLGRTIYNSADGGFLIYVGIGGLSGSRDLRLFPRARQPQTLDRGNYVQVITSHPDLTFWVSKTTSLIEHVEGGTITEDLRVYHGNQGGIEVQLATGILIDSGWQANGAASANSNGISKVIDADGRVCRIVNSKLFHLISSPVDGDFEFRFQTDQELGQFLRRECPALLVDF